MALACVAPRAHQAASLHHRSRALPTARAMAQAPGGGGAAAAAAAAASVASPTLPDTSRRVRSTDDPVVVYSKRLMATTPGTLSLAQGIVHWAPPAAALDAAAAALRDPSVNLYGPDEGMPALREALRAKIAAENGLAGYDVVVTTGANQAFAAIVLALLDADDGVVLFKPYYFNHRMAVQMSGGDRISYGPRAAAGGHPDLDWLAAELAGPKPPKMVVITNPCNPTGVLMAPAEVDRAAALCAAAGAWLVLDNTYEHFVYQPEGGSGPQRRHHCAAGPNVINIFSFSKAYGMMGWRMGYIAYPEDGQGTVANQLLKVQDTIPVCGVQISQHVALAAVQQGRGWVDEQIGGLAGNRAALLDALSPLGASNVVGGEGAIYFFAKLPEGCEEDQAVVEWLVRKHRVCLIPGTACGTPGYVRAAFANLTPELCAEAAARLKAGLTELVEGGMPGVRAFLEKTSQ